MKFSAKYNDKTQSYQQNTFQKWPFGLKFPIFNPPGYKKGMKMNFQEKAKTSCSYIP